MTRSRKTLDENDDLGVDFPHSLRQSVDHDPTPVVRDERDATAGIAAACAREGDSGSIQRISCSRSVHTRPPVTEIGTPVQKLHAGQLASHHDISIASVTTTISASEPTYSHRINVGAKRRSSRMSRSAASFEHDHARSGGSAGP